MSNIKVQYKFMIAILIGLLAGGIPSLATTLSVTWNPQAGDEIKSADVRTTIAEIESAVNNIDADNITDSSITSSKLASNSVALDNIAFSIGFVSVGCIMPYAGDTTANEDTLEENGWLFCDGSAVSRSTYSSLYAVTGTKFGPGNGSTTFNLPDFRGRVPIGTNPTVIPATGFGYDTRSASTVGDSGGREVLSDSDIFTAIIYPSAGGPTGVSVGSPTGGLSRPSLNPYLSVNYVIYAGRD